mgnify:FL=1
MPRPSQTISVIVRVVSEPDRQRIVLLDLRSQKVQEFDSWEAALKYLREVSVKRELR